MTSSFIVPILLALWAPAEDAVKPSAIEAAEPASESASEPAAPEAAAPVATAPQAAAPDGAPRSEAPEGNAEPATDPAPEAVADPFDAPPAPEAIDQPPAPVVAPPPPPPPRPIRWRLDFGMGVGTTVAGDLGVRAFTERRNLPDIGTSAVFDFRLAEGRFFLGGGIAYQHIARAGDANGSQITTKLELHEPFVLGRASVMLVEGLDAFARVGVGPSIVDMRLRSEAFETANQRNVIPRVDGRAGLSLYLPKAWLPRKQASRITAGIDIGLGYTWRGKIDVQPELEQDDEPLRAITSPWGTLSMHGLSWGVGLFLRVM